MVDKRGLAVYFEETGLYDRLIKEVVNVKNITQETLVTFVSENESTILEGLKKYFSPAHILDPQKLLTAIGSTVEGVIIQLNPAAYAAKTVTDFATVSDKLLALTQELGKSEPQLKIKHILMPYQSNPASQYFQ